MATRDVTKRRISFADEPPREIMDQESEDYTKLLKGSSGDLNGGNRRRSSSLVLPSDTSSIRRRRSTLKGLNVDTTNLVDNDRHNNNEDNGNLVEGLVHENDGGDGSSSSLISTNYSYNLLTTIPSLPNPLHLLIILLSHNGLTEFDSLICCVNVVEIDLSYNCINGVPGSGVSDDEGITNSSPRKTSLRRGRKSIGKTQMSRAATSAAMAPPTSKALASLTANIDFFAKLPHLKILRLNNNQITSWKRILPLSSSPSILYLTLHGNPFSFVASYRPFVVNLLPTIKALDFHVTTDEELIEGGDFPPRFKSCCKEMELPAAIVERELGGGKKRQLQQVSSDDGNDGNENNENSSQDDYEWLYLKSAVTILHNIHFINSPTRLAQSCYRRYREVKEERRVRDAASRVIQKLGFRRIWEGKLQQMLDNLLVEEGYESLLLSRREGRRVQATSILQLKWREVLRKKREQEAIKKLCRWFRIRQEKFRELLRQIGDHESVVFGKEDEEKVLNAVKEVHRGYEGGSRNKEGKKHSSFGKLLHDARAQISKTNFLAIRNWTMAEVIGVDCKTDGVFRFDRSEGRENNLLKGEITRLRSWRGREGGAGTKARE